MSTNNAVFIRFRFYGSRVRTHNIRKVLEEIAMITADSFQTPIAIKIDSARLYDNRARANHILHVFGNIAIITADTSQTTIAIKNR